MIVNFVGNTVTQSEAIETYTPYDVTSCRPRKTKIAFFANFGGIEKLFCAPEQSLNSKIMNQGQKFHFIGTLSTTSSFSAFCWIIFFVSDLTGHRFTYFQLFKISILKTASFFSSFEKLKKYSF